MPEHRSKPLTPRATRRRMLATGIAILVLLVVAGIALDLWFAVQLRAALAPTAGNAEALPRALHQPLLEGHGWLLTLKGAILAVAALLALRLMQALYRQIEQLTESRARNRAIVDHMVDGAIHIDADGRVVALNAAAEDMFGHRSHDLRGRALAGLLTPAARERIEALIHDAAGRASGEASLNTSIEVEGLRRDGSSFPLYLALSEVRVGRHPVFTAIARDLTETERQMRDLAEARDQAMAADRAKSEFLAVMSHEIRTPMNGILGMLDLLRDGSLNRQQLEFIETAEKSSSMLLGIINDILDLSKIEAGKLDLQELDFDLTATVEEVATLMASHAQKQSVEVICFVERDVPQCMRGDPYRLRQILTNLIGNAVKFTREGEVVVHVGRQREHADGNTLRVEVRDSGIGIEPAVRARLFQPFTQADASTTRRFGGTGLGLAISKRLVERMGGEIGVESTPGAGSTFWFTIRLGRAQRGAGVIDADLSGARILIVDDNATNRMILERYLTQWGAETQNVDGGRAALEALRAAHDRGAAFALAILDLQMPDMDGIELAQRIKGDTALAEIELLMLSSTGYPGAEARRAGIGINLLKPVRQGLLREAVMKALQAAAPAETAATTSPASQQRFAARALLAEDNPVNQKVIRMMLERCGIALEIVADGEQAAAAVAGDHGFDVIFMDVQMPVLSGLDAARRIRAHEQRHRLPAIPIIAMTAAARAEDREACLDAGMDDFVSKPIQRRELETAIAHWLRGKEQ